MSWSMTEALTDPAIRKAVSFRSEFKFFPRRHSGRDYAACVQTDSLKRAYCPG